MINPKDFLSNSDDSEYQSDLVEIDGTFSCPEQGCYEVTLSGKFNERERIITWVCSSGHLGRAMI